MSAETGDIPVGDVHIRDGEIVAVGSALEAPGAESIDGRDAIALPGFIDTHWHMADSLSPLSELRVGFGFPKTRELLDAGVTVSLSVDTPALCGNVDMFGVMKTLVNLENARAEDEFALSARRALDLATIDGARALGIAERTGSLEPGKRADLILVSRNGFNRGYDADPAELVVGAMQPADVDTVVVDGRILKRHGRPVGIDVGALVHAANAASDAVRERVM